MNRVDCLIVGQGLAGTTLAWALRHAGASLFVVDRDEASTSSRIAAGLMTSVTGQRLVPSWRWDELWPAASRFYRWIEPELGETVFHPRPMVRLLTSPVEEEFVARRRSGEHARLIRPLTTPLRDDWFTPARSTIELPEGGRLDVPRFLDLSREVFRRRGEFASLPLLLPGGLELTSAGVHLPALDLLADRVVFCEGIAARNNPWLGRLRFNPARGEILTLRILGLDEDRILHRGLWLARQSADLYRAGATYDWKNLEAGPTPAGRDELTTKLHDLLKLPFEVVGHDAAIRPILHHLPPIAGFLPDTPRLGLFNGLGSKGALQAPFFANQLAAHIVRGEPLDPEVDWSQRRDLAPE